VRKDFAVESLFFVAAAAYSQLFCELLGKYLLVSELRNAQLLTSLDEYFSTVFNG